MPHEDIAARLLHAVGGALGLLCLALAVVLVLGVAAGVWVVVYRGPTVRIERSSDEIRFDVSQLGEYCIGVSEIRLTDQESGEVVWLAKTGGEAFSSLCAFTLRVGPNPVVPERTRELFAVIPRQAASFTISGGTPYSIQICGNNGFAYDRCRRLSFTL